MKNIITTLLLSLLTLVSYSQTELDMLAFKAVNEYRVEHGVKPLVFDSLVWKAAEHHTVHLQDNGYPHNYPLSSGHFEVELEFPSDRLEYFGVRSSYSGECIASWGGRDTDIENINKVISQWDGSPPHKKGMLSKKATKIAISIVGVYWEKDMSFTYKGNFNEIWISGTRYIATLLVVR
jgi:uncharacterized protein YkwD